jgi:hypothetical protein
MTAGDSGVVKARYAKAPTSAISGVTHAKIDIATVTKQVPGQAGTAGPADEHRTMTTVKVTLYGNDQPALVALMDAKSSVVLGYINGAGANEKITLTNVRFNSIVQGVDIPEMDSGGKVAPFAISGTVAFGSNDTLATVYVAATDT